MAEHKKDSEERMEREKERERERERGEEQDDDDDEGAIEETEEMKKGQILKQGYLWKRSHNIKHSWKKRWFVLRLERLNIYKDEREYELLRFLKLRESVLSTRKSRHREHTFMLQVDHKKYDLQASSEEEKAAWVEALKSAGAIPSLKLGSAHDLYLSGGESNGSLASPALEKGKNEGAIRAGYFSDDNENTSESEGELPNPLEKVPVEGVAKQGYLYKQTLVRKKWKKRWVVLRESGSLMYYKNDQEYVLLKLIKLHSTTEIGPSAHEKHHKKQHVFQLATAKRTFYFAAGSEEEMNTWVAVLREKAKNLPPNSPASPSRAPQEHFPGTPTH